MGKQETTIRMLGGLDDPATRMSSEAAMSDEELVPPGGITLGFAPQVPADGRLARTGRMDAQMVTFTTAGATNVRVDHDLGREPRRFTLIHATGDIRVWKGTVAWNASSAFFQASAAGQIVTVELA